MARAQGHSFGDLAQGITKHAAACDCKKMDALAAQTAAMESDVEELQRAIKAVKEKLKTTTTVTTTVSRHTTSPRGLDKFKWMRVMLDHARECLPPGAPAGVLDIFVV